MLTKKSERGFYLFIVTCAICGLYFLAFWFLAGAVSPEAAIVLQILVDFFAAYILAEIITPKGV